MKKHDEKCENKIGGIYYGLIVPNSNPPMLFPCHCVARRAGKIQAEREIMRIKKVNLNKNQN